jgi:teichuronic acid biosynthesis glycosyltransferase TuaH
MPVRKLVVVAAGVNWDGVKGSERQLAEAMTEHADVLWVDPPVSPVTPARYRGIGAGGRSVRSLASALKPRLYAVPPDLRRLTPVGPPGWTRPVLRSLTWPLVRAQIHWALRRLGREVDVFVACTQHDLLGHWGRDVVDVLYGTDDWIAGAELMRQDARRVAAHERIALSRADVVLAVGPELARRWRASGAEPHEFPNGCDPTTYERVRAAVPAALPAGFPAPIAGLIGQLTDRIDIGLLEAVADTGLGLLLVGPREDSWEPQRSQALLSRPNVQHAGPVPFDELPRWLARIDVGLTPYADTAFNRASFPLKTLEYLSAGLPVVSTDLPASRRLREQTSQILIAADPGSFAGAVFEAATVPEAQSPAAADARLAVARAHSWSARADSFAALTGLHRTTGG